MKNVMTKKLLWLILLLVEIFLFLLLFYLVKLKSCFLSFLFQNHTIFTSKPYNFHLFVDMDECLMPGICPNAECKNKPGSHECECKQGFRPNDQGVCDGKKIPRFEVSTLQGVCAETNINWKYILGKINFNTLF